MTNKTVMVPVEPTKEMIEAAHKSHMDWFFTPTQTEDGEYIGKTSYTCVDTYKAMLEAAPKVEDEPVEMPYLLRKCGMWYAHNSSGYTARAELAELYTKEYAESHANHHEKVSAIPLNEIIFSADRLDPFIERMQAMQEALQYAIPKPPEQPE
jgi:hypothetical protein